MVEKIPALRTCESQNSVQISAVATFEVNLTVVELYADIGILCQLLVE